MIFTRKDCGCWIDGTFGTDHAMRRLAGMIEDIPGNHSELLGILNSGKPEFLSDDFSELDKATEILQGVTSENLVWVWDAGDLDLREIRLF